MRKLGKAMRWVFFSAAFSVLSITVYAMLPDRASWLLLVVSGRDETQYPPGIHLDNARKIAVGMTQDEVRTLLGVEPVLAAGCADTAVCDVVWSFSWAGPNTGGSGWMLDVVFKSGRVVEVESGLWVD